MRWQSGRYVFLAVFGFGLLESCGCDVRQLLRRRRGLVYPDPRGSETKVQVLFGLGLPMEGEMPMTLGYVIKCNYNLPYNSTTYTHGHLDSFSTKTIGRSHPTNSNNPDPKENHVEHTGVTRWSLYRILESLVERSCLLRAVCEAAELPFHYGPEGEAGLAGQLFQALLAPSSSREEYEIYADREYHKAEELGKARDCRRFWDECPYSPLDYFTRMLHF